MTLILELIINAMKSNAFHGVFFRIVHKNSALLIKPYVSINNIKKCDIHSTKARCFE